MSDEINDEDHVEVQAPSLTTPEEQSTDKETKDPPSEETELSELSHVSTVKVKCDEDSPPTPSNHEFCVKKSTIPRRKAGGILKMGRKSIDTSFNNNNNAVTDGAHVSYRKKSDEQIRKSTKFGPDIPETSDDTTTLVPNGSAANGLILPTKILSIDDKMSAKNKSAKVSWNETVVYASDVTPDFVADNTGEDNPSYQGSGITTGAIPKYSNKDYDASYQRTPLESLMKGNSHPKQPDTTTQKCCIMVAVMLIVIAIIGLIVLGVMYALRIGENKKDNDPTKLQSKLNLRAPGAGDLFVGAWHSRHFPDTGILYLVANTDKMPWQKPATPVNFMWHRGSPLIVYSIKSSGISTSILGDPIETTAASYSLTLSPDAWHAARVFNKDTYSLFSVMLRTGSAFNWTEGDQFKLEEQYPSLEDIIRNYVRK